MWKSDKPEGKRTMAEEVEAEETSMSANLGRQEATEDVSAFVGKGVEFKGTISYNGTVRIDGSLDGEIHTDGVLLVGEEAVITAKVTAGTIVCKGKITGDVVGRGADEFDAALVGLPIGIGSYKGREERMVNINHWAADLSQKIIAGRARRRVPRRRPRSDRRLAGSADSAARAGSRCRRQAAASAGGRAAGCPGRWAAG